MFEDKTFESILDEMLNYVKSRNSELDINVGSIIYTALAPIALELETTYHNMDMILDETFIETASKEYLIKFGQQIGLPINEATCGRFIGMFNAAANVEIGCRFNLDKFNYTVVEFLEDKTIYANDPDSNEGIPAWYFFELVCETPGTEPNTYLGDLTPITYVNNLTHAEITEVISKGEDEEDTESYRYRLRVHAMYPPIDGNVSQYADWLDEYDGVGKYKILPCWNGVNTVKLVVLDTTNTPIDVTTKAGSEFMTEIQNYFDPPTEEINDDLEDESYPQGRGMGNGQAPIGAIVTVESPKQATVKIECQLKLKTGYSGDEAFALAQKSVDEYLKSIALENASIKYMAIWSAIYKAESVEDILNLVITVTHDVEGTPTTTVMDIYADQNDEDTVEGAVIFEVSLNNDEVAVLDILNSEWGE